MKKFGVIMLLLIGSSAFNPSQAFADMESEISHLLSYIENSPCSFIRNGTTHNGADAKEHIVKKYNYFKERINSAEQFIEYAATKSTMSGKKYKVQCAGKEYLTAQWLHDELKKYRNNMNTSN
ncbi:DUF5329 family protein [Kaarinaea lacus]